MARWRFGGGEGKIFQIAMAGIAILTVVSVPYVPMLFASNSNPVKAKLASRKWCAVKFIAFPSIFVNPAAEVQISQLCLAKKISLPSNSHATQKFPSNFPGYPLPFKARKFVKSAHSARKKKIFLQSGKNNKKFYKNI
jgi:hypothetical protein